MRKLSQSYAASAITKADLEYARVSNPLLPRRVLFAVFTKAQTRFSVEVSRDVLDSVEARLGRDFPDPHVGFHEELNDITDAHASDLLMDGASEDGFESLFEDPS